VFLPPSPWAWIDPGVFALFGAGAFMGGTTRLTIALAVIMMEVWLWHSFGMPCCGCQQTLAITAEPLQAT
jgi:H+/Cl- antiporter ClcA